MTSDPFDDPALPELVAAALEQRDRLGKVDFEAICRKRPDLLEAVSIAVEASVSTPGATSLTPGRDRLMGTALAARYRIDSLLGAGAMGVVYRAQDLELGRPVAIKVLNLGLIESGSGEDRFDREAAALAAIEHSSVVPVYDRGRTEDGEPYLVMGFVSGQSLGAILKQGHDLQNKALPDGTGWVADALGVEHLEEESYLRLAVRWTAQIAGGLAAAHDAGIFHRDVKPSNVIIRPEGDAVLIDFGIARLRSQTTITHRGSPLGTPAYMAPESLSERFSPKASLDVYGLAATLYHAITLRPPYSGSPSQILTSLLAREPQPAQRVRAGLPRDLCAILDRGMARRASDRYLSVAEFQVDLRAFLEHRPVKARPISPLTRGARTIRRSPAWRTFLAMVFLIGFFGAGWKWLSVQRENQFQEYVELWRQVPPNLGLMSFPSRVLTEAQGKNEIFALLDSAARKSLTPLPSRLVRASVRLDHGDPRGAAEDVQAISAWVGTDYARELASRYRALDGDASSVMEVDLAMMPPLQGPHDRYLQAYHLYRRQNYDEALEGLGHESLADFLPAQELLALGLTRKRQYHRTYELATRIEQELGSTTASTRYLAGLALTMQKQYAQAHRVLREGATLAPTSLAFQIQLGFTAYRLGRPDDACRYYENATRLKPLSLHAQQWLVRSWILKGDLDNAERALAEAHFPSDADSQHLRLVLSGLIEVERSLDASNQSDSGAALAAAERARDFYAEAATIGPPVDNAGSRICAAILDQQSPAPVFTALMELLRKEPMNSRRLAIIQDWMPASLDAEQIELLAGFLAALEQGVRTNAARPL